MDRIRAEIDKRPAAYGKYGLHAQVGVMEDTESTPGGRIPIGEEPELPLQIQHFTRMHKAAMPAVESCSLLITQWETILSICLTF